ncbi:hypothetical protein BDW02DRAFT_57231 [Decorospora gaudefroyi]|uniref:Uncharacterized protein n=1 Tax=Decorospora gaudefroyi TaxID=184978 RepID=A0A6A5KD64_9PLEO|nr:hypothetical protein BDW02DRAFT_57231 [Decorospora gaudefroyi]
MLRSDCFRSDPIRSLRRDGLFLLGESFFVPGNPNTPSGMGGLRHVSVGSLFNGPLEEHQHGSGGTGRAITHVEVSFQSSNKKRPDKLFLALSLRRSRVMMVVGTAPIKHYDFREYRQTLRGWQCRSACGRFYLATGAGGEFQYQAGRVGVARPTPRSASAKMDRWMGDKKFSEHGTGFVVIGKK